MLDAESVGMPDEPEIPDIPENPLHIDE